MTEIDELIDDLWITPADSGDEVERAAADLTRHALRNAIASEGLWEVCPRPRSERRPGVRDLLTLRRRRYAASPVIPASPRRTRRRLIVLPVAGLAAALAAVLLVISAGPATPPAYALTRHADGSITITLTDVSTGIPALNARLRELGIDETVIPIVAGCESPDGSGHVVMRPDPYYEYRGSVSTTFTPGPGRPAPAGWHYVLAAKQLPNGKFLAFIGALKAPIPTCLPYENAPTDNLSMLSEP